MKLKIKYAVFLSFAFLCFNAANLYAQETKTNEALLDEAMKNIYSNPQKSIATGERFLLKKGNNPILEYRYLMLLAQANVMIPDYEKSLEYANRAVKLAEENELFPSQINANTFLGNHYLRLNLEEKSWQALERSEKIIKNHPLPDSLDHIQGNVFLLRGYLFEADLKLPQAINAFGKAANIFRKTKNKELGKINLAVALTHKGRVQLQERELDSSQFSFEEAIRVSSNSNQNGVDAFAYLSLAEVYAKQEKNEKSNQTLFKALEIAQKSGQLELEKEIYKLLSENYFKINDLDNYSKYHERYQEALKKFDKSQTKSVEKIAKTIETKKDEGKDWTAAIVFLCGLLLTVIIFLFFRSNRMKKKMNP